MTRSKNVVDPFGTRDESLLHEGKYGEWFYKGMDPKTLAWLDTPVVVPTPPPAEPVYRNQEFSQPKRWRDEAACIGADPGVFFVGSDEGNPRLEYMKPDAAWRQYCPDCPVRELCLELARESKSVGIFGGKLFVYKNRTEASGHLEYDETTMPKKGRPRTNPMTGAERCKAYRERKKANARVSTAPAC